MLLAAVECVSSLNRNSQLADGELPEAAILWERFGHFQELLTSFNESETAILPTGSLIKYLWLRPHFVVKPCHAWQSSRYWFYPLLNALNPDDDAFDWLRALVNQRVIESADLIDRQRERKKETLPYTILSRRFPRCVM